jgi:hypothetical protein
MGLQDVRAVSAVSAYKACKLAATVRLQYKASTTDHSLDTATVSKRLDSTVSHY